MLPVIVARRVRHGGPLRPAEFAALCIGVPHLLLNFERLPIFGLLVANPGRKDSYSIRIEAYRIWMLCLLIVSTLAALLLVIRRRSLPKSVAGFALLVVWLGSLPCQFFVQQGFHILLDAVFLPSWGIRTLNLLVDSLPFLVIGTLPTVAAILDVTPSGWRDRTWLEWTCLVLALGFWLVTKTQFFITNWYGPFGIDLIIYEATTLVAVALCVWIVRRFGPGFRRWMKEEEPR